jgi:alpha-mannosidase
MAQVADSVHLENPGLHLVVFNPSAHDRSGLVKTPMREFDNCGSDMVPTEDGSLRGVILQDRWHVNPEQDYVDGKFDLIDVETGKSIPYQINIIPSSQEPVPYAAQRVGIADGGKRYGVFEDPAGLKRDLVFHAEDVGAVGYRTYYLRPREDKPAFSDDLIATDTTLENKFYRLELDPNTGSVASLLDKETGRELIDPTSQHSFGSLVTRDPFGGMTTSSLVSVSAGNNGPLEASLRVSLSGQGSPYIEQTYTLYADVKRIDVGVCLLKDPTALLETYLAFPFNLPSSKFRYEGPLCAMDPAQDLMPGAYADRLTVQNWVSVSDGELSVLWTSMEAPVVSLAQLWPGRVSPAHSAKMRDDVEHPRPTAEQLRGGTIYSLLTANNFGTNFSVTQCGSLLYRYSITTAAGPLSDAQAVDLGQQSVTPFSTIFTEHPGTRPLPPTGSFLSIDKPEVQMVTLKHAEDGNGLVLRLWNPSGEPVTANVALPQLVLKGAKLCNLGEEVTGEAVVCDEHSVAVPIGAQGVATVRMLI